MKKYNVMILSAGRRVELVQCFQEAAKRLNIESDIIAADCSEIAPALYFADQKCRLPRIDNLEYINSIITESKEREVALIIPTIDTDLLLLSNNKSYIEEKTGAKLLISDIDVISTCRDKINSQYFFENNGFKVPKMYDQKELKGDIEFPLFIKPKSGSSSINAFKVNSREELNTYLDLINDPIVQDFMEGEEYTVDVFLGFSGKLISIVPRLRMATRSGEIAKGKIVKDRDIINDVTKLMKVLKPIGHITVQLIKTKKGIEYLEINPRFGGGAPMSIKSGADSCENLFRLLNDEVLEYHENYKDDIMYFRFDQSICVSSEMELLND